MAEEQLGPTLAGSIAKHPWLVAISGVVAAFLIYGAIWVTSPPAVATGTLGLVAPPTDNVLLPLPAGDSTMARYTGQRAEFAMSDAVLSGVVEQLPDLSVEDVRKRLEVDPATDTNTLEFIGSGTSPEAATQLVEAAMASYRTATQADVAARSKAAAQAWRAAGNKSEAEKTIALGVSFGDGVEFESLPGPDSVKTRGRPGLETMLGLLVGLGAGSVAAWVIEDSRYRRRQAAQSSAA